MTDDAIVALCERERDLAPMTIVRHDGMLVARPREDGDRAPDADVPGMLDDRWRHVRSGGRYLRRNPVVDGTDGADHYHYVSLDDGRSWMRAVAEWREEVDGRPRFERLDGAPA